MITLSGLPGLLASGQKFVAIVTNLGALVGPCAVVKAMGSAHTAWRRNMPYRHTRRGLRTQDPIRAKHEDQEHTQ
ncbi:hypothetical protein [Stenotrophomonas acidaminiphila]|uniref:hypothetical protein n=1 Tax=Stenotrophomonas acidaminiphila TaxID=128780 RepID=UPI0028AD0D3C|nr:hypothetical protein [Stenotrophomonas acidaminiphila]